MTLKLKLKSKLNYQKESSCQFIFIPGMLWPTEKFYGFSTVSNYDLK